MSDPSDKFPPGFKKYKEIDPFESIPPALLNSADIYDYAVTTGMIDPFYSENLKSGSYVVNIKGEVHSWKENKQKEITPLRTQGDRFTLERNSIAYLFLDTKFFLPDYIAMRFNLKIQHVHRGLLLGTGPLVDPGFAGQLFIPLHNLTTNPYTFRPGDGIIWAEFTKLSPIRGRKQFSDLVARKGTYIPFPLGKMFMQPKDYIEQATLGNAVLSSIPDAISGAVISAEEANTSAKIASASAKEAEVSATKAHSWVQTIGLGGLGAVIISVAALLYQAYQLDVQAKGLIQDGINYTTSAHSETSEKLKKVDQAIPRIEKLEKEIRDLKSQVQSAPKEGVKKR